MPDCALLAIVDNDFEVASQIAQKHGVLDYSNYYDTLSQVDAVSLVALTCLHYKIAREILKAGIHCLGEKPICEAVEEVFELIRISNQNKLILQVGHVEWFNRVMSA